MKQTSTRAGRYISQPTGYSAFVPTPLPPDPPLKYDDEMIELSSRASEALGRLDESAKSLPNPDLFVMMYVRKEAVLSSQIEGTQASLAEVLELEAKVLNPEHPEDAAEVVNYVKALNHGLERLNDLPVSLRLIKEIHGVLLSGTRGQEKTPGEFRRSQNWIGPKGSTLNTASFIPPAVDDMKTALGDWEKFLHDESPMPFLIRLGLAHAQLETIHPFLDGNGRVGRLLITFLLCERKVLHQPLLYLSYYFKQNQQAYYFWLQGVREHGDWEGWIKFFLKGVAEVANEAVETTRKIAALRGEERAKIVEFAGKSTADAFKLHDRLFEQPYVTVRSVQDLIGKQFPAANGLVQRFVDAGIIKEVTGQGRNRVFVHQRYLALFEDAEVGANTIA